ILDVPYLGPDGIGDSQCIKDAGDQATDKMYYTNAAADASQDSANKDLIAAFTKAFPQKDDTGAYTFPAYDCAKIVLDALSRASDHAVNERGRESAPFHLSMTSLSLLSGSRSSRRSRSSLGLSV